MLKKLKNILIKVDNFFYKKFGSYKSTKILENTKEAQIIFSIINGNEEKDNIRFVGGCVRKSIFGEYFDDIDLATIFKPNEIKEKLSENEIQVIDTGILHGTVTAILNNKKFEITTLRKDILTDGRHAKVEFTTNWEEDALRRDFTINAIYADIQGRIFDPLNGVSDLKNGVIKFIGSVDERVQEDYLRILRYFRFFTQYSKKEHDHNVIRSIKKYINGLNGVSNERIFDELKKILSLDKLPNLFTNKISQEIFINVFPQIKYYERLKMLKKINQKLKSEYNVNLILAILILDESNDYEYFCHKYKTSNKLKNTFKNISANFESIKNKKFYSKENIKKLIYFNGKNKAKDLLLFSIFVNNKVQIDTIESLLDYVNVCPIPKFPISGDYLKQQGYETGQALGKKLKSLEEKWINNNFVIDKKTIEKSFNKDGEN